MQDINVDIKEIGKLPWVCYRCGLVGTQYSEREKYSEYATTEIESV